ncbi:MAG: sigma-54 dependent transcriptional regulator [Candidatus Cloacimonetes bacterium]|nr:sigma-54 dependent transcriptional regulator [Candidatus Cloacimonadota bacterium]
MNILIVDDERNIGQTLKSILEDEGYRCVTAGSGRQGLDLLESFSPGVVLLDVQMEHMDGLETLKRMLAADPTLQIIMISGHSGISEAVQAIKLGAFDFLEKPLSLPHVKIAVSKAMQFRALSEDVRRLRSDHKEQYRMVGDSQLMQELREMIERVAATKAKVLIRGESGTGKELVAWAIHQKSRRSSRPFIKFNSAAIPSELVESELFGFEKGAFTGAVKSRKGKIEEADGGTLFLDEIGDMSLSAQAKILRVIQEGEFERVGSNATKKIDARIIAATHKNLEEMVQSGAFREDLFYRLDVVPVVVPPLRRHTEDIPLLLEHFSDTFTRELGVPRKLFLPATVRELSGWKFAGNIRELKNLVERIYILVEKREIAPEDLPVASVSKDDSDKAFWQETAPFIDKKRAFETRYLDAQLTMHNGNISQTAKAIGMHQSNLSRKLKELGITSD